MFCPRKVDRRQKRRANHVDRRTHLRWCVRKIEEYLFAANIDCDFEIENLVDEIGIERVPETIRAIRYQRDAGARSTLRGLKRFVRGFRDGFGPVFVTGVLISAHAQAVCGHLCAQVIDPPARHLAIEKDEMLHVLLQRPCPIEPDRRYPQSLLVDMGVAAVHEIGMMCEVGNPGDQRLIVEDRLHEHEIIEVRSSACIGIVADEDVAGLQVGQVTHPDHAAF